MWVRLDSQSFTSRYIQGKSHWVTLVPHAAKRLKLFPTVMCKTGKKILSASMRGTVLSNCLSSCPSSPKPSRLALQPSKPPVQWVPGFFSRLKWYGHGVDHSPPSTVDTPTQCGQGQLYLSTQSQCKPNFCCSPVRWHLKSHWPMVNKAPCHQVWCNGGEVPHS